MRDLLREKLMRACTLSQFLDGILDAFQEIRHTHADTPRIGYVSGIVSSDGPEYIEHNLEVLQKYTDTISKLYTLPTFCAGDIFSYNCFEKLEEQNVQHQDLVQFWYSVLGMGYITDVFMTTDWKRSKGATEEHVAAKELGLTIYYLAPDFLTTHTLLEQE